MTQQLKDFATGLFEEGKGKIKGNLKPIDRKDRMAVTELLRERYEEDVLEMPGNAPDLDPDAALWGMEYMYRALQFALLRDLGEEEVNKHLKPFPGKRRPESIYSADLALRYLPDLFMLAKGLSPEDVLVKRLAETAMNWPFSSVGIETEEPPDIAAILEHPSLTAEYRDRIIAARDSRRAKSPGIEEAIIAALGTHAELLWPEFETTTTKEI